MYRIKRLLDLVFSSAPVLIGHYFIKIMKRIHVTESSSPESKEFFKSHFLILDIIKKIGSLRLHAAQAYSRHIF